MNIRKLFSCAGNAGQASRKFIRNRDKDITERQAEGLVKWLAADDSHEKRYQSVEDVWALTGALQSDAELLRIMEAPMAVEKPLLQLTRRRLIWSGMAAAAAVVLSIGVWAYLTAGVYYTGVSEQRLISLEDGSVILLNTDTRLSVRMSATSRQVVLEKGEALFEVTHDENRPFLVDTGQGLVRDLGTKFNIYRKADSVTVSVLEGSVEVETKDKSIPDSPQLVTPLTRGQEVTYSDIHIRPKVVPARVERIDAWRAGRIRFSAETLRDAVDEFNRYSKKEIILGDPKLEALLVTGTFRIGNTQALVAALAESYDLEVEETTQSLTLRSKK